MKSYDINCSLSQVYLPAIAGHVPTSMVKCLVAFLDFYYIAHRNAIDTFALVQLQDALDRFHHHRKIFTETGVCHDTISLPRQHSLKHYPCSIHLFRSPNGLCSSITESKHIDTVKGPWRHSSGYKSLYQMLRTNERMDKMAAMRAIVRCHGMLKGSTSSYKHQSLAGLEPQSQDDEDEGTKDKDVGQVQGPATLSSVKLARTPGEAQNFLSHSLGTDNSHRACLSTNTSIAGAVHQ